MPFKALLKTINPLRRKLMKLSDRKGLRAGNQKIERYKTQTRLTTVNVSGDLLADGRLVKLIIKSLFFNKLWINSPVERGIAQQARMTHYKIKQLQNTNKAGKVRKSGN